MPRIRDVDRVRVVGGRPLASVVVLDHVEDIGSKVAAFGSGFKPGEAVLVVIEKAVTGGEANASGALEATTQQGSKADVMSPALPASLVPGLYTVRATGSEGTVAATGLTITPKP